MSQFLGMNVENILSQVVPGFENQSTAVREVISAVERLITTVQTDWKGRDSEMFVDRWTNQYKRPLEQLAEDLAGLANTAKSNAEAQQQQSDVL